MTTRLVALAGVSSLGVPGVPWHPQILADQLTLSKPGGTNYAHLINTDTPGFSDLPTTLFSTAWRNNSVILTAKAVSTVLNQYHICIGKYHRLWNWYQLKSVLCCARPDWLGSLLICHITKASYLDLLPYPYLNSMALFPINVFLDSDFCNPHWFHPFQKKLFKNNLVFL